MYFHGNAYDIIMIIQPCRPMVFQKNGKIASSDMDIIRYTNISDLSGDVAVVTEGMKKSSLQIARDNL